MSTKDTEAILALRERDAAAAKAGDFETLRSILSDDAVVLPPGERPQIGKKDIDAAFAEMANAPETHKILDYILELSDPEIVGSYAFEHGAVHGTTRSLEDGKIEHANYHVLRVLRKESEGKWKVYRTIWTQGDKS